MKTSLVANIYAAALQACDRCKRFVRAVAVVYPFCVATLGCHGKDTPAIHAEEHETVAVDAGSDATPAASDTVRFASGFGNGHGRVRMSFTLSPRRAAGTGHHDGRP